MSNIYKWDKLSIELHMEIYKYLFAGISITPITRPATRYNINMRKFSQSFNSLLVSKQWNDNALNALFKYTIIVVSSDDDIRIAASNRRRALIQNITINIQTSSILKVSQAVQFMRSLNSLRNINILLPRGRPIL